MLRWLAADVIASDRVRAGSLQPYLSAINRVHRDMDEQEPALGHLVQQYRRGLAHRQADAGRGARRVYLPPDVAGQLMEWALAQRGDDLRQDLGFRRRFRASVAVLLTLCLFARGGTGSALCVSHMCVPAPGALPSRSTTREGQARGWHSAHHYLPARLDSGSRGAVAPLGDAARRRW